MLKRVFNLIANNPVPDRRLEGRNRGGMDRDRRRIATEEERLKQEIDALDERRRIPQETEEVPEQNIYQEEPVKPSPQREIYHELKTTNDIYKNPFRNGITKALFFGRHGNTETDKKTGGSLDFIVQSSFPNMFKKGQEERIKIFGDQQIRPDQVLSITGPKKRVQQTTRAFTAPLLVGAKTYVPKNEKELAERHGRELQKVPLMIMSELDYEREVNGTMVQDANPHAYKIKGGPESIVNHWLTNRNAREHTVEGKTVGIKPGYEVYGEMERVAATGIAALLNDQQDIRVVDARTHGTKQEILRAVFAEAAGMNVKNVKDIGGMIDKEGTDMVIIHIDPKTKQYIAILKTGDKVIPGVNLHKIVERIYSSNQQISPSYDLNHEPSAQEIQLQQQRGYSPEDKREQELQNTDRSRLHRYTDREATPGKTYDRLKHARITDEEKYAGKN